MCSADVSFLQYRPSAVAAAAALLAIDELNPANAGGCRAIFCEIAVDMVCSGADVTNTCLECVARGSFCLIPAYLQTL
jgi:hypothetical protein